VTPSAAPAVRWAWLDLRLVPVAAVVWGGSIAAPWASPALLAAVTGLCLAGGLLLARRKTSAMVPVTLAVLAALAVTAGSAAVRTWEREDSPVRAPDVLGRTVEAVLELDGDPHRLSAGAQPRVVADATVLEIHGVTGVDAGVLIFAPADGWRDLLPGQPVRARVSVSEPRPGQTVTAVLAARGPPTEVGEPGWGQRRAGDVRAGLLRTAARVLEPRPAGLLPGLVVGDTTAADPVLEEEFRRAGLAHLTAVSGANVAIVLAGVLWPLRRRAVDRRVQVLVAALALVGFVVLARPTASVVRAAAMGAVGVWALAAGRPRAAVPALAAAVTVLLLVDPDLARDAGFALSVAATAAIVLVAGSWSRRLRDLRCPPLLADGVAVSAAAGLATAPLVAGLSGTVSLVTVPANLLAAPAVPAATVLGLLAAVIGPVVPALGDVLVWLAGWPVRWLVLVGERAAGLPDAAVGWPAGSAGAVGLTALLLTGAVLMWRFHRLRLLALAALVGLVVAGWPLRQVTQGWPPPRTVLVACDVGQGDALVLPTGPGAAVLVDAGPEVGPVDRCLDRLGIEDLPLVVLSHLDADHVGGLAGALAGRRVGAVATGALSPTDHRSDDLDAVLRRAGGVERVLLTPSERMRMADVGIEILAPEADRATVAVEPNDLSLVLRVTVRGLRVLLTGDLGAGEEARLVRAGLDLRADVLKVPHHGSGDADPDFLAATGARVAIITVGADNAYGHPAPRLLTWLARAGMRVHRTDREGDVAVAGDSDDWGVASSRNGPDVSAAGADDAVIVACPADSRPRARNRRTRVTRCGRARRARVTHLEAARRGRGGGAPAGPRRHRRPHGGGRAPPRCRGPRTPGARAPRGAVGRRAGSVAVRWASPGRGHRGERGRDGPRRRPRRVREGPGPGPDAGDRALRRQAQRGAAQGLPQRRGGRRRVPQADVGG
jgi:competence protein ComEC